MKTIFKSSYGKQFAMKQFQNKNKQSENRESHQNGRGHQRNAGAGHNRKKQLSKNLEDLEDTSSTESTGMALNNKENLLL